MRPYQSTDVANTLLGFAEEKNVRLTPMQVVKLVYISHGWSLGLDHKPLILESVEAWKYGPVVPELYSVLKKFGSGPVVGRLKGYFSPAKVMGDDGLDIVRDVYKKYGQLSGIQLSHLTHRVNTPWAKVYSPNGWGQEIPNSLIESHYIELAQSAAGG